MLQNRFGGLKCAEMLTILQLFTAHQCGYMNFIKIMKMKWSHNVKCVIAFPRTQSGETDCGPHQQMYLRDNQHVSFWLKKQEISRKTPSGISFLVKYKMKEIVTGNEEMGFCLISKMLLCAQKLSKRREAAELESNVVRRQPHNHAGTGPITLELLKSCSITAFCSLGRLFNGNHGFKLAWVNGLAKFRRW